MKKFAVVILLLIVSAFVLLGLSACNNEPQDAFFKKTIGDKEYFAYIYREEYLTVKTRIYMLNSETQKWTAYEGHYLAERYTSEDNTFSIIIPDTVVYLYASSSHNITACRLVEVIYQGSFDMNDPDHADAYRIIYETAFE